MEWSETVRLRYAGAAVMGRGFVLTHRRPVVRTAVPDKPKKGGLFGLFQTDVSRIRRELYEQSGSLRESVARVEKAQRAYVRDSEKRATLLLAGTNARLGAAEREVARLKRSAAEQHSRDARIPPDERPIGRRVAERMLAGRLEADGAQVRAELERGTRRLVREAVRRLREDEDYGRRRTGGGRRL